MSSLPTLPLLEHLRLRFTELEGAPPVAELSLHHGRANEMGSAVLEEWELLTRFLEQGGVSALITTSVRKSSKGTPIFIAGADVTERREWAPERVKKHVRWQRQVLQRLRRAPVMHIGVVGGVALGWGTEFMLCCDYRIAVPGAIFGLPETGLGIVPGAGGTSELWSLVGVANALRLGMSGERIDPEEARRIGLVDEVCSDHAAGMSRARQLATLVGRNSPTAVAAFKRGVLDSVGEPAGERAELEAQAYERCVDAGEAAIGRKRFAAARKGGAKPAWGPLELPLPDTEGMDA